MSKRALILEAASLKHKRSHYPHNPYCDICLRSHMRQMSMSQKKERKDDELPAISKCFERISADNMMHQQKRVGSLEYYTSFTVRDEYSGVGIADPKKNRTMETNRLTLKNFVGRKGATRPNIMVKSDAASEITRAVEDLGWLAEPSLKNRFPHNALPLMRV